MKTNTTYTVVEIKNGKIIGSSFGWTLVEARELAKMKAANGVTASIENSRGTIEEVVR
jgi:hypothetical protein